MKKEEKETKAVKVVVCGRVTGVGFRYYIYNKAKAFSSLRGYVRNVSDREVEAVFQGKPEQVEYMIECMRRGSSFSRVENINIVEIPLDPDMSYFHISS